MESEVNGYEINFWVTECSARTRRIDSDLGSNPALRHENRMAYRWLHLSEPKERQMLVMAGSIVDMARIHTKSRDVHKHKASQLKYSSTGLGEFQLLGKFLASWCWGINPGSLSGVERGPHWESKVFFFCSCCFVLFLPWGKPAKSLRTCNL